jgi:enoyl-CoA hydratase/carnithine racemase
MIGANPSMHQTLHYREDEAVATIRLHRPEKKNSLNAEMRHELASLLKELARKPAIRVVVITGGDEIFCASRGYQRNGRPSRC